MPPRTKATRHQRRVVFPSSLKQPKHNNTMTPPASSLSSLSSPSTRHHLPPQQPKAAPITVLGDGDEQNENDDDDGFVDEEIFTADSSGFPALMMIPDLFTHPPLVRDALVTQTSHQQDKTADICMAYLAGDRGDGFTYNKHGIPSLDRERHVTFLRNSLGRLPGGFVAMDAARPWLLYWAFGGLAILGEDLSTYRETLVETARAMQNEQGGFGGGGKQTSHLAATYAVVLALALVGGEEVYEVVDRKAMWKWLCSLKQPDGGFQVCVGGEEDIRGAYCATVIITLLNLPLDLTPESPAKAAGLSNLLSGVPDYVHRCQTYEGGISGQPNAEAHGAYAFCALGCLALLDDPRRIFPRYLDVSRLLTWLSSRQYAPEGGFSGRTNKLVDGCYSHWVGDCFPLIEACLSSTTGAGHDTSTASGPTAATAEASSQRLPPAPESLFSREGLIRCILCCCQDDTDRGGLRDKPGKRSDGYHTNYVLCGLSSAQHLWSLTSPLQPEAQTSEATTITLTPPEWSVSPLYLDAETALFNQDDRVRPVHPAYAIPQDKVQAIREYFLQKEGFF